MSIVDKVNPAEAVAYLEQIYNTAFWKSYGQGKTADETLREILKEYRVDNMTWNNEILTCKNDQDIRDYIIKLFIMNLREFTESDHKYRLFTKNIFDRPEIKRIGRKIRNSISRSVDGKSDLDLIDNCTEEIFSYDGLSEIIIDSFYKRVDLYRIKFNDKVGCVCFDAYRDSRLYVDNSYAQMNGPAYNNYSRRRDNKMFVEIVLLNDEERVYIAELCGRDLSEIFKKYSVFEYLFKDDGEYSVEFGFDDVFDIAYEKRNCSDFNYEEL